MLLLRYKKKNQLVSLCTLAAFARKYRTRPIQLRVRCALYAGQADKTVPGAINEF